MQISVTWYICECKPFGILTARELPQGLPINEFHDWLNRNLTHKYDALLVTL